MNKYIFSAVIVIGMIVVALASWVLSGQSLSAPVITTTEGNLEENLNNIEETNVVEKVDENGDVPQEAPAISSVSNQSFSMVLPPKPDPSLVDATLKGVDVNNNSIRDEAEHYIAENITATETQTAALEYAKNLSQLSSFPLMGTKADEETIGLLMVSLNIDTAKAVIGEEVASGIYNLVINTPERKEHFLKVVSFVFDPEFATQPQECTPAATVFGVRIPLEPDKVKNDSTLLGIDANNNQVRDDVERLIACNVKSSNDFLASMDGARQYQKMLALPEKPLPYEVLLDIYGDLYCAEGKIKDSNLDGAWSLEIQLGRATFNTEMRQQEYMGKTIEFGGFFGSELKECSGG